MEPTTEMVESLKADLKELLELDDIHIPVNRLALQTGDVAWLGRNFMIQNRSHERAGNVLSLIKSLLRLGVI